MKIEVANILSLPSSVRREYAIKRSKDIGLKAAFFDATQADQLDLDGVDEDNNFYKRYGRNISKPELAALVSHRRLYKKLSYYSDEFVLILEDDFLPINKNVLSDLVKISDIAKNLADVVILGYAKSSLQDILIINFTNPIMDAVYSKDGKIGIGERCIDTTCGCVAILASKNFLKIASNIKSYDYLADDWGYYKKIGIRVFYSTRTLFLEDFLTMGSDIELARSEKSFKKRFAAPFFVKSIVRFILRIKHLILYLYKKRLHGYLRKS
jgi:hypothetical protein